jgi:hypothetical protein
VNTGWMAFFVILLKPEKPVSEAITERMISLSFMLL